MLKQLILSKTMIPAPGWQDDPRPRDRRNPAIDLPGPRSHGGQRQALRPGALPG